MSNPPAGRASCANYAILPALPAGRQLGSRPARPLGSDPQLMSQGPWQFLATASPAERRALVASTLGWMLDGMDVTLYAMVIAELLREFELTAAQAGLLASLTLIASAAGGILFGVLADRAGRRRALMASILVYSVFTAACGLSRTVVELALFRFLLGLGMGGEWATGAALVAETWRAEHRGKALGLMQSGFAIGYALAAVATALVLPRWGWRAVFFVGILPALVTLWIRRGVEESPLWAAQKLPRSAASRSGGGRARFQLIFASRYHRPILITLLMNSAALFGWWGLFTWIPPYLALPATQGGRGLTIAASSLWIVTMQAGMWLGYVTFGFVSDALGRKRTYVAYLLLAAAIVPLYARAQAPTSLLLLGPIVAFFGTGHFTGFGIITAELFPTSFRASAMGFTYNFGRALSAAAPWLMGWVAEHRSLNSAFWISGVAFLLAGLLALGIPETRGRSLDAK
jgi:MFS family permease